MTCAAGAFVTVRIRSFALFGCGFLSLCAATSTVTAADLPVRVAPAEPARFYAWIDGSYESINLPKFTLGPAFHVGVATAYGSQVLSLNSDVSGYGISGGVGFRLPGAWWGSN